MGMLLQSKNSCYYTFIFGILVISQSLQSAFPQATPPSWKQIVYTSWNQWKQLYQKASSAPSWVKYAGIGGFIFVTFVAGPWLMHKKMKREEAERNVIFAQQHEKLFKELEARYVAARPAYDKEQQHKANLAILGNVDKNLVTLYIYLYGLSSIDYKDTITKLRMLKILYYIDDADPLTLTCKLLWDSPKETLQNLGDSKLLKTPAMQNLYAKIPTKDYFTVNEIEQLKKLVTLSYFTPTKTREVVAEMVDTLVNNFYNKGIRFINPNNEYIIQRLVSIMPNAGINEASRFRDLLKMLPIAAIQSQLIAIRDGISSTLEDVLRQSQQLGPAVVDPAVKKLCDDLLNKIDQIMKARDID